MTDELRYKENILLEHLRELKESTIDFYGDFSNEFKEKLKEFVEEEL